MRAVTQGHGIAKLTLVLNNAGLQAVNVLAYAAGANCACTVPIYHLECKGHRWLFSIGSETAWLGPW